jgi:hypothetical protein
VGTYVAHSEKILLFQTKTGKILPIPNENEITEFICGCLLNYHYSAVLPLNIFKKEFKPRNNVIYFECN